MDQVLSTNEKAGAKRNSAPRLVGEILHTRFENGSDSLVTAYREHLFSSMFPNSEVDIDLKLLTREPGRIPIGGFIAGILIRDDEGHYTFFEDCLLEKGDSQ